MQIAGVAVTLQTATKTTLNISVKYYRSLRESFQNERSDLVQFEIQKQTGHRRRWSNQYHLFFTLDTRQAASGRHVSMVGLLEA